MKHIKYFENKFLSHTDPDSWEPDVRKLYDEYKKLIDENQSDFDDIEEDDIRRQFNEVQIEFDEMDLQLPLNYGVYFIDKTVGYNKYQYFGIYLAKGEMHALVKCAIDMEAPDFLFDTDIRCDTLSEDYIKSKIRELESELNIWKNIK